MNAVIKYLYLPDDVKSSILEYDSFPRKIHGSVYKHVMNDIEIFFMLKVIHREAMDMYGFTRLNMPSRYRHFRSTNSNHRTCTSKWKP